MSMHNVLVLDVSWVCTIQIFIIIIGANSVRWTNVNINVNKINDKKYNNNK